MIEKSLLEKLRQLFNEGESLTHWITSNNIPMNEELISIIYDLQAGTYTASAKANPLHIKRFATEIAAAIKTLPGYLQVSRILDCGIGEGTTLIPLLDELGFSGKVLGFDISPSRASWAALNAQHLDNVQLFVAEMSQIPIPDHSIDLVLTVHSIEPNGAHENLLIRELSRVTARYVVMVEPDFESASLDQKARMNQLGYIGSLHDAISLANLNVIDKVPLEENINPLNKASIWLCEKSDFKLPDRKPDEEKSTVGHHWIDPLFLSPLDLEDGWLKSPDGVWYPTLNGMPLLRKNDGVFHLSPPVN